MEKTLDEFLAETDGLAPETEETHTIPTGNEEEAARALRELGQLTKQAEANTALAKSQRQKITDWETQVNEPLQNRMLWLRGMLEQYARAEREESGGKKKSVQTPFGKVSTTIAQPKWAIGDPDAFIAWALVNAPQLVETKQSAKLGEAKKTLTVEGGEAFEPLTGDAVPGITITDPGEPYTYTITTA
jgi:phage host-nuclease inhibitor protein Gam